ncbi:MAG TPA: DUF3311 domain-containing protein [Kribbella sp.]
MDQRRRADIPPANRTLLAVAGVLLAVPLVGLLWVDSYARKGPVVAGFPFFIWYQFLWVFLCSAMTYTAYRIVLKARPHRPMSEDGSGFVEGEGER